MNFGDLGLNVVGRQTSPLSAEITGELTVELLGEMQTEGNTQPARIQKLRQRHHALAKAISDGIPDGEAGLIAGYTPSRVSILKRDPTFIELQQFYANRRDDSFRELHDKIAALGEDVVDEIASRLEDDPDAISVGQLIEVGKLALDRSGHGPQSNTNVNVNIGLSEKLATARARAQAHRAEQLVAEAAIEEVTIEMLSVEGNK